MQENKQSVIERVVRLVKGNKIKTRSKSLCGRGVSATDKNDTQLPQCVLAGPDSPAGDRRCGGASEGTLLFYEALEPADFCSGIVLGAYFCEIYS